MKKSWRFVVGLICVALVSALAVHLAGRVSGPNSSRSNHQRDASRYKSLSARVTDPVTVPGYSEPLALVGDPAGSGVWFIAASTSDEAIFHWNALTSQLQTFPFATSSDPLPFGDQASLTIDSSGIVWAGIHSTLIRLNPSTGAIEQIAIPQLPTDSALVGGPGSGATQPRLFSTHDISGVASAPNGTIVISVTFSSILLTYDPASGTFSQIALPAADIPTGLNVLTGGTIVVTANSDSLTVVRPDGSIQSTLPLPSSGFGCGSGVCAVIQDPHTIEMLDNGTVGPTSATSGSPAMVGPFSAKGVTVQGVNLQVGRSPIPLRNGEVLASTVSGFDVVDPSTASTTSLSLPSQTCTTRAVSVASGPVPSKVTCQETPVDFAVDSAGNVWFTSNSGTAVVFELPLSGVSTVAG